MAETSGRRKRQAEDEGQDVENPIKRGRPNDAAHFKWLWSPPRPSTCPSSPGRLWSQPIPDGMFLTCHDLPYSFSVAPEPAHSRRPRRRGAISATSPAAPSEWDRHLAQQLQQQIAVIGLKSAAERPPTTTWDKEDDRDDEDAEIDGLRRELESVQIDATLPSILGISIDFDRKLCLGTSSRPSEAPRHQDNSSPTGSGPAASPSSSTCCHLWQFGNSNSTKGPSPGLQVPCYNGYNLQKRVSSSDGGLWMRPRA